MLIGRELADKIITGPLPDGARVYVSDPVPVAAPPVPEPMLVPVADGMLADDPPPPVASPPVPEPVLVPVAAGILALPAVTNSDANTASVPIFLVANTASI